MSWFDVNRVEVSGNLTRDPELRSLPSGLSVCKIGIAHNERVKDGSSGEYTDRANYFDVTVWGKHGEWVASNLSQGDKVMIDGRLRWRSWEVEGGGKRSAVDITAEAVIPCQRGGGGGGNGGGHRDAAPIAEPSPGDPLSGTSGTPPAGGGTPPPSGGTTPPPAEDDIPF